MIETITNAIIGFAFFIICLMLNWYFKQGKRKKNDKNQNH